MKINYTKFVTITIIFISFFAAMLSLYSLYESQYYKLLFLLPLTNIFLIVIVNKFGANLLLHRVSIMITVIFYFIKNTIVPALLVLGDYSTYIADIYLEYTSLAIILSVYEILIVSIILAINMSKLKVIDRVNIPRYDESSKVKYSKRIKLFIILFFVYILVISYLDTTILRQTFMLMVGTPDNWYVRAGYREIGADGTGVLGIFATLVNSVFWLIQAIFPPIALTWVINSKSKRKQIKWVFVIAFSVLMIVTGTRIHAVESALAIVWVSISIYGKKVTNKLPPFAVVGGVMVLVNLIQKSSMSTDLFQSLSRIFSSYFSGIQNVSASVYAAKNIEIMNISLLPTDIVTKIPYIGNLFESFFGDTSASIFNTLIGQGSSLGQILPAIGQGYIYFGFILAPIIPSLSLIMAINFEKKALWNTNLIYKNIYILAAIMLARIAPSTNMMSGIQYLFYTYLTLFIAWIGITRFNKGVKKIE